MAWAAWGDPCQHPPCLRYDLGPAACSRRPSSPWNARNGFAKRNWFNCFRQNRFDRQIGRESQNGLPNRFENKMVLQKKQYNLRFCTVWQTSLQHQTGLTPKKSSLNSGLRPKIKPNFFVADQFGFEGKLVLLQTGFQQKSQKQQLED